MKRKTNPDASKDILVVIPKQKTESLIWDRKFAHLVAFFSIPYTIAFLKFCRKLGMELSLDKTSGICIPGKNGSKRLDPNTNPCLTALTLATILDFNKFSFAPGSKTPLYSDRKRNCLVSSTPFPGNKDRSKSIETYPGGTKK